MAVRIAKRPKAAPPAPTIEPEAKADPQARALTWAIRLTEAREKAGLTREQVAGRMGVTSERYAAVEDAETLVWLSWLHVAAISIGCTSTELNERLAVPRRVQ